MKTAELIKEFEQNVVFVDEGTVALTTELESLDDWDSMATIATIALMDEKLGVQLKADQLASCKTVGDIFELVKEKLED